MDSKFLDAHESLESHGVSTMVSASLAQVVLCLRDQGLGLKQISRELKVSRNTVRRFSRLGHWEPYKTNAQSARVNFLTLGLGLRRSLSSITVTVMCFVKS